MLPKTEYVKERLTLEGKYFVLLRPSVEKMKQIRTEGGVSFWDALRGEEIIAIVEIKMS